MSKTLKQIAKIRKRRSYNFWKNKLEALQRCKDVCDILEMIFQELDWRYAFKSSANSSYSLASLNQLIEDYRLDKAKVKIIRKIRKRRKLK